MRKPLTERQQAIYEYIAETITSRGAPPTIREIMDVFDISSTHVELRPPACDKPVMPDFDVVSHDVTLAIFWELSPIKTRAAHSLEVRSW